MSQKMQSSRSSIVVFTITAADEATEIFLINGQLKRIASGVGKLEYSVKPGFYKVRFRSGARQYDDLIDISGLNASETLQGKPIDFYSSAPISRTATSRPDQANCAAQWSHGDASKGSSLFIFLRQETDKKPITPESINIFDLAGKPVGQLSDGQTDPAAQCAGLCIDLEPGTYRLRVSTAGIGQYEMFVTLCAAWQTQVFLTPQIFEKNGEQILTTSLRRASVFMTHLGYGFDPDNPYLRLTELSKHALSQGRNIASKSLINAFLKGKFQDPVMGLAVAHLLLRRRRKNMDLINTVLNNLGALIGDHPDLIALRLGLKTQGHGRSLSIEYPPMFNASWDIMTQATRKNASLIAQQSIPGTIAHNVTNSDTWLLHRVPEQEIATDASISLAASENMFMELLDLDTGNLDYRIRTMRENKVLSGLEQSILNLLKAHNGLVNMDQLHTLNIQPQKDPARVLRQIPAPAYSIAAAVQSLHKKF